MIELKEDKTLEKVEELLAESGSKLISMGIPDIDGRYKGKFFDVETFLNGVAHNGGFLCDILFGWDITDEIYEGNPPFSGWPKGFPDIYMIPDFSSFRIKPWGRKNASVVADAYTTDGELLEVAPRTVLKQMVSRAEKLGYKFSFGYELEFYVFKETSHTVNEKKFENLIPSTPTMTTYGLEEGPIIEDFFSVLWEELNNYGIPIESLMYEAGKGQFEFSIEHDTPLKTADKILQYKSAIKEIAARHGMVVTFMAKQDQEQSGSSGHVHQSICTLDDNSKNLYWGSENGRMSTIMKQSIAGLVETLPSFTALYCPTINSYSRLVEGSWTGTNATWGIDNRTTAIRAILTNEKSIRIENRLPGADANPYLVLAACMAASLYGIENKLELPMEIKGNAYLQTDTGNEIPLTLESSIQILRNCKIAKDYFNKLFLDHYIFTREWELEKFRTAVTDWEIERYLEQV